MAWSHAVFIPKREDVARVIYHPAYDCFLPRFMLFLKNGTFTSLSADDYERFVKEKCLDVLPPGFPSPRQIAR